MNRLNHGAEQSVPWFAAGVIGLPNVGKISLINSLKRTRVAAVGNTPGVTKSVQEVHLDKNVKLLDSPGIVFSAGASAASALRNCVKVCTALRCHVTRSCHFLHRTKRWRSV